MASDADKGAIVAAEVTDLNDPERLGRVRVTYPHLDNQTSDWARLVTPGNGPNRGTYFKPQRGDEVLVAWEHGDPRRPYILGGLWNTSDKPPDDDGKPDENNWRFITSRSGHVVKLDDTQGSEKIEIVDKSGGNSIVIDTAANTITISATQKVVVNAQIVEIAAQTIEVKGDAKITVEAPEIEMKAVGQMTLDGGASLTIRGGIVSIN